MDESEPREQAIRHARARKAACRILGVGEQPSAGELKRAWRRACREHHPDRNPGDPEAESRFAAISCAYRFLAHGETCAMLFEQEVPVDPEHQDYRLDNAWGFFLWWRNKFF